MRRITKKLLTVILTISMICSLAIPEQAQAASKVQNPSDITRGQACQVINTLLGATELSDDMKNIVNYNADTSYYGTMSIAYNAGYLKANTKQELAAATTKATYNFVATAFSRILKISKTQLLGKHKSGAFMTLTELTTYLSELIPNVISTDTIGKTLKDNAIVNQPNVTLKDTTVTGNLIVGDGVADQEVILENVVVNGKLIVRGGGENSVKIYGTSSISTIVIEQVNNSVSIKVSGDSNVQIVYINDGCDDITLYGPVGTVNVTGDGLNVYTENATIDKVLLTGENSSFHVSENTKIDEITVNDTANNSLLEIKGTVTGISSDAENSSIQLMGDAVVETITAGEKAKGAQIHLSEGSSIGQIVSGAENTVIAGDGKVEKATLNGNNSEISTPGTVVTIGENTSGVKKNDSDGKAITPAPTAVPTSTPSSSSGSNSGSGSSPTPTVTPSATPSITPSFTYETDNRFATGYPMVQVGPTSGSSGGANVTLKIKLKDDIASAEAPANVYYLVVTHNASFDVTSTSVIHGHLGTDMDSGNGQNYHQLIDAYDNGVVKITDNSEVSIPLTVYSSADLELITYYVIKTSSLTSTVPTKIAFSGDTVASADTNAPIIEATYWSNETASSDPGMNQRTIRLFTSELLDTTKTASSSAFTVNVVSSSSILAAAASGASITGISVHKNTYPTYEPYQNWIDLTLVYPTGADLSNLSISYLPPASGGFADVANIPNQMPMFTLFRVAPDSFSWYDNVIIQDPEPQLNKMYVSADGKYLKIEMAPGFDIFSDTVVSINGVACDDDGRSTSLFGSTYNFSLPEATGKAAVYNVVLSPDSGSTLCDNMGTEYPSFSFSCSTPIVSTIVASNADIDLNSKILSVTLTGANSNLYELRFACQFVLTIDGTEYRLRGEGIQDYSNYVEDSSITFRYDQNTMYDVDFSKITSSSNITLAFEPLTTDLSSVDTRESSGKPFTSFTLPVVIK